MKYNAVHIYTYIYIYIKSIKTHITKKGKSKFTEILHVLYTYTEKKLNANMNLDSLRFSINLLKNAHDDSIFYILALQMLCRLNKINQTYVFIYSFIPI